MAIKIKTKEEIGLIRAACRVVSEVLIKLKECLQPDVTTYDLDREAERLLREFGAVSAFKGYRGYPAHICTSINEEVVHGIPGKKRLKEGDIISLDVGARLEGYFGDVACTFGVGRISQQAQELLQVSRSALDCGISQALSGKHVMDISSAIQTYVESSGYSVVRRFVGHGIGQDMHEEPEIPNLGSPGQGPRLKAGMILAIEPMVNTGGFEVEILEDKWTAVTQDKELSAHFEHTICITEKGPEVLTSWE